MRTQITTTSLVVFIAVIGFALTNGAAAQDGRKPYAQETHVTPAISSQGLPGLVSVPTATVLPTGTVDLNFNTTHNDALFGHFGDFTQWNINFAIGFFSRLVVGGRGAEVFMTDTRALLERDLSANLQLLLFKETQIFPSLALGWQDVSGGGIEFQARYAVASKTIGRRFRLTAGYGIGPQMLDGLFGGIEAAPLPFLHLLAEHDGYRFATGARILPVPPRFVRAGFPQLAADILWNGESGVSWGLTLRTPLDPVRAITNRNRNVDEAVSTQSESGIDQEPVAPDQERISTGDEHISTGEELIGTDDPLIVAVQSELLDIGLESVRVGWADPELTIEYENRRYNRNELDALARVYQSLAPILPGRVETVSVTLKEVGLPVFQVAVPAEDLPELADRSLPSEAIQAQFGRATKIRSQPRTRLKNPSRLKLDLIVAPGIETIVFTEIGVAKARLHAIPEVSAQLFPGAVVAAGALIPLGGSEDFPSVAPEPHINGALGHLAFRLPPLGYGLSGITQFSGGLFTRDFFGWINETAVLDRSRRFSLGGKIGIIRSRITGFDRLLAVARGRYYIPQVDTRLTMYAGLFFDQDRGVTVDVARFFGDTEIGLFLRTTTAGSLAGIRIALPLSPIKDMRPYRVRIRPPSLWGYEQRTTVFTETNLLRYDIGRVVLTGHEIEDAYHNRDRMSEGYFLDYFSRNQ